MLLKSNFLILCDLRLHYDSYCINRVKSDSAKLREAITTEKIAYLDSFDALYLKTYDNTVHQQTTDFLGKLHEIQTFSRLHIALVDLINQE